MGHLYSRSTRYNLRVDTIRLIAKQRHLFTAEVRFGDFGHVLLVGDPAAVERVISILGEHDDHDFEIALDEPPRTN